MKNKKEEVKPQLNKSQECALKIQELLEKYNCRLMVTPQWFLQDNGTYALAFRIQVVENNQT